jgi:hypothetical protein
MPSYLAPIGLAWADFKVIAATNKARMRSVSRDVDTPFYYLTFVDSGGLFECAVLQDGGADVTELETYYLPYANKNADASADSDLVPMSRPKITTLGWTLQDHWFEFTLGTVGSVYSKTAAGVDTGFVTMKFYKDVAGVETLITGADATDQTFLTANAIRTDLDWEATHDVDIISGDLRFYEDIVDDVRFWCTVVPDIPAIYGGSKELITGGRNLRMIDKKIGFLLEGRTVKHLIYSATYHTNKFKMTFRHAVGVDYTVGMAIGLYKA